MERESFPDPDSRDATNKKFWDGLHDSLGLTIALLKDFCTERGIDLESADAEEQRTKHRARKESGRRNPLVEAAREYSIMGAEWFAQSEDLFKEKQTALTQEDELGIGEPELTVIYVLNAVDVIRWHQDQIRVKLMRALDGEGLEEEMEWEEEMNEFPRDSDGSAKVALIAIDRSIGAWGELRRQLGEEAERITDILVHLSKLRTHIENHFPRARSFVRPGFDQDL